MRSPSVIERPESSSTSSFGGWKVKVYNNDFNTFDEVANILMIATRCSLDEAAMETWEIDHLGYSVVHYATQNECEVVATTISSIGIRTEVLPED